MLLVAGPSFAAHDDADGMVTFVSVIVPLPPSSSQTQARRDPNGQRRPKSGAEHQQDVINDNTGEMLPFPA